jgi:hypothetical protein
MLLRDIRRDGDSMSKMTSLRKSLRRVLGAAVVAVLLAVGFVAPAKAIPSSMTLYIHYARSDNSYSTWFNHIWCRNSSHADTACTITEGGDPVMNLNGIDSYGALQIIHITSTGSATIATGTGQTYPVTQNDRGTVKSKATLKITVR